MGFLFDVRLIDAAERAQAQDIERNVSTLLNQVAQFHAALALLIHAEEAIEQALVARLQAIADLRDPHGDDHARAEIAWSCFMGIKEQMEHWSALALRQAALIAYGFHRVSQAINSGLRQAPLLAAKVQSDAKNAANATFNSAFPRIADVRKPVAHPGEFGDSRVKMDRHMMGGPYDDGKVRSTAGVMIFEHDTFQYGQGWGSYSATLNGEVVSLELSRTTLDALQQSANQWLSAFHQLAFRTFA